MSLLTSASIATARRTLNFVWTIAWRLRVRFGPDVRIEGPERLTVILLSYRRPQNIEPIVRAALKCSFVQDVVVQNNNPEVDIDDWIGISSERLRTYNSPTRLGPRSRWTAAARVGGTHYLAIDDDVFLFPGQLAALFSQLLRNPDVPHGVHGVVYLEAGEPAHVARSEGSVDVLHQLYFVTDRHVNRFHEVLAKLADHAPEVRALLNRIGDDIIMSHCGAGPARIHDVGRIPICPTSHAKGIAVNQRDDFLVDRALIFETVRDLCAAAPRRLGER